MPVPDNAYVRQLLGDLRLRRLEGSYDTVLELTTELLRVTTNPGVLAEVHMARGNMFMWSTHDPGAAMISADSAVMNADVAYAQNPTNAHWLVGALTLHAEFLRWEGIRDDAQTLLDRAMALSSGSPVLEGQVRLGLGRMLIGEPSEEEFPHEMADHFEAAAGQLRAGTDQLMYAWALVHDVYGMYCIAQFDLAAMAMDELERLIEQGLTHPGIVQIHTLLTRLMQELGRTYRVQSHTAVLNSQLLRLLRI